jgi:hypothetical protein
MHIFIDDGIFVKINDKSLILLINFCVILYTDFSTVTLSILQEIMTLFFILFLFSFPFFASPISAT